MHIDIQEIQTDIIHTPNPQYQWHFKHKQHFDPTSSGAHFTNMV